MVIWPNLTGMVPGWSPSKIVQMVLIGCICRSRCQNIGFQNAIFKNLLVWNYKAQSFHIWYIASSRGPLPKLFKLCPWGQNWPRPGGHNFTLNYIRKSLKDIFKLCPWGQNWPRPVGHNFTLNYIRKSSNDFFSWTTNGNVTKLKGMVPGWSPTKIIQLVLIGCICRSRGQKNRS